MSFWAELRRRNVFKVGAAYAILAWLLTQIASVFVPALSLPDWVTRLVAFLLILGFPVALILAWAYEITPRGIERTKPVPLLERLMYLIGQRLNYALTLLLLLALGFLLVDSYVVDRSQEEGPAEASSVDATSAEPNERDANSTTADSERATGQTIRLSISVRGRVTPQLSAAISPDGSRVAFVATDPSGIALLWVRALDQLEARALPGTERAAHPFWSPDGRALGFVADGSLKRVEIEGGTVRTIAPSASRGGAAWSTRGTILFVIGAGVLASVPASGGSVTEVLASGSLKPGVELLWPAFLPDGRHFLVFGASETPENRGIYLGSLDSGETTQIMRSDFRAMYAEPGYLVFPVDETLLAQPFDAERLELSGEPVPIAEGVWFARGAAQASFSVSAQGDLAYVNASLWDAELAWFDRSGRSLGSVSGRIRYEGVTPQIAPDGARVAVARGELLREAIWTIDSSTGAASRLTFGPERSYSPVWSADGRSLLYARGLQALVKDMDTLDEKLVLDSVPGPIADWSRDERFVVFSPLVANTNFSILRLDDNQPPFVFEVTPFNQTQAQLSPDGQWIAYTSNESGRDEVYLQTFPNPGRKRQVSTDGGAMPRWRADGAELFYVATNQFLTAVPVANEATLALGTPTQLFRTRLVVQGSESLGLRTTYDVAPDGERFLLRQLPVDPGPPITVVLNWTAALTPQ